MRDKAIIAVLGILLILTCKAFFEQGTPYSKVPGLKPLPMGIVSSVTVAGGKVVVRKGDAVKTYVEPKFGGIEVLIDKNGNPEVKEAGYMPRIGIRPMLGVAYTGKLEPALQLELLRIEPVGLGASVAGTPSFIGIALEKDISTNTSMGLATGIDLTTMQQKYAVLLSVSF